MSEEEHEGGGMELTSQVRTPVYSMNVRSL
jgi:hypothetical protein